MEKDPFIGFISQIANKIKIEQDHKRIINDLNNKPVDTEKASLKNVILTIQEKISENSGNKEIQRPEVKVITEEQLATSPIVKVINEEENNFEDFVSRLKTILNKTPDEKEEIKKEPILEKPVINPSVENKAETINEIIPNIKDEKEETGTNNYLDVLDRLQDKIAVEKEDVKVTEIKKLIEEYAEKYVKRVVGVAGESGGGTNAVQYARGGTMDGDLNVTGNYLSAGVNLLNVFAGGGGGSTDRLVNGSYQVVLSSDGQLNVPGAIVTASNSKLDLVGFGPNTAYLTTTPNDSTALFMGAAVAELRASNYVSITTNVNDTSGNTPHLWEFGTDGSLGFPDNLTIANSTISNLTLNDYGGGSSVLSGSQIEVVGDRTTITNGVTSTAGASILAARGQVTLDSSKAVMEYGLINSLGGGSSLISQGRFAVDNDVVMEQVVTNSIDESSSLIGRNQVIVNSNVLIGRRVTTITDGNTITNFSGWTFDNGVGSLTFPQSSYIGPLYDVNDSWFVTSPVGPGGIASADGQQYIGVNNGSDVLIGTGWPLSAHEWAFGADGSLRFPDNTTQTTAYTGIPDNIAYTNQNTTFGYDVTINGNLTALGSSTFKNTIFTTTSALSVINTGPGPALYIFQAAGPYDVASFYDGDGIEVLHVGNANAGQSGKVGINESYPGAELTVNGAISSNRTITVLGGNSNQWNSVYTTTNTNSAYLSEAYTNLTSNSAAWNSVYSTVNTVSAATIVAGGNTRGANIIIGTNDAFHLRLETNDSAKMTILSSGEVGIGTTIPETAAAGNGGLRIKNNLLVGGTATIEANTNITGTLSASNFRTPDISNIGVGTNALVVATGANNTAVGANALASNTTGYSNTANGANALLSNTTGVGNTANGVSALLSNTTGNSNTANGVNALYANTTGSGNTANGVDALRKNTTGFQNTANGVNALQSNTTGFQNTANGVNALVYNTTGDSNTANGLNALLSNTTGSFNTGIGAYAGDSITSGTNNTIIGPSADVDSGARSDCVVLGNSTVSPAVDGSLAIGNAMGNLVTSSSTGAAANKDLIIYLNGVRYYIALKIA